VDVFTSGEIPLEWHFLRMEWPVREAVQIPPIGNLSIFNHEGHKEHEEHEKKKRGGGFLEVEAIDAPEDQIVGIGGVAWVLAKGQKISEGLGVAAECYREAFGRWPEVGVTWEKAPIPSPSPILKMGEGSRKLKIIGVRWVVRGCLVVC